MVTIALGVSLGVIIVPLVGAAIYAAIRILPYLLGFGLFAWFVGSLIF